jgi:hypothetical protein
MLTEEIKRVLEGKEGGEWGEGETVSERGILLRAKKRASRL